MSLEGGEGERRRRYSIIALVKKECIIFHFIYTEALDVLMVVRGDVELIDLSGQGRTCLTPQVYPGAPSGPAGLYDNTTNTVKVCGGKKSDGIVTNECYDYVHNDMTWTSATPMLTARYKFLYF